MGITGIAIPKQKLQFVDGKNGCTIIAVIRPPFECSFGQSLLAQPETLPVVHQCLDSGRSPVSKDKDTAGKRVGSQDMAAYSGQSIYPFPEVHRIHREKYPHVRCYLDHNPLFQNALMSPRGSMPAFPWICIFIFDPLLS